MQDSATVLLLDDFPDQQMGLVRELQEDEGCVAKCMHPADVELSDVEDSNLILVDYSLTHWPERDAMGELVGLQPPDGLALASIVRRHAHRKEGASPTAVAILTNKLSELMAPLSSLNREHIISRLNGLEWVFSKSVEGVVSQIATLAQSVSNLPKRWTDNTNLDILPLVGYAHIDDELRQGQILEDLLRCRPPIHDLSVWSHGIAFLRWLLHRILPYPCFLIDEYYLAARLQVEIPDLQEALAHRNSGLRKLFSGCEYRGLLEGFLGTRWWRSEVESVLWRLTDGSLHDANIMQSALFEEIGQSIRPYVGPGNPVVCHDKHFRQLDQLVSIDEAVRVSPDDWPAYADSPWITLQQAREEPEFHNVIDTDDRAIINAKD